MVHCCQISHVVRADLHFDSTSVSSREVALSVPLGDALGEGGIVSGCVGRGWAQISTGWRPRARQASPALQAPGSSPLSGLVGLFGTSAGCYIRMGDLTRHLRLLKTPDGNDGTIEIGTENPA